MKGTLGKKGFTLIELLIVISGLAILLGIMLPNIKGVQDMLNIQAMRAELATVKLATTSFVTSNNRLPQTLNELTTATPQIINEVPADRFSDTGAQPILVKSGLNYIVYSVGPLAPTTNCVCSFTTVNGKPAVKESDGKICIYVSNLSQDRTGP